MSTRLSALLLLSVAACTTASPTEVPVSHAPSLQVLPGGANLALVRRDLLATASERFGAQALDAAMAAPFYVIAKRFAGMAPPPPPGAGADWRPPTPAALLMRDSEGWRVATPTGWRPANPEASVRLDRVLADPSFWDEAVNIPPCPDHGASLLLVKIPGRAATVRKSSCTSIAEKAVFAALES